MTSFQLAIVVLTTAALAETLARVALRPTGVGAHLAAGLVVLPFALLLAVPFAPPERVQPAQPEATGVRALSRCQVVLRPGDQTSRYAVRPARCRPLDSERATFSLGPAEIRSSTGERLRIVPGWVAGNVERSIAAEDRASVDGWIGRIKAPRRAIERVLVFVDGRFVATLKPTIDRSDVAQLYGDVLLRSGFGFDLSVADLPSGTLQLFGVDGNRTSAIVPDCGTDPQPFGC
jgi:hypothetical protein